MKGRMVTDPSDLALALLKQYSQGKDRGHSAALTDVSSDWTPHLDQLVPTERRPPQREILTWIERIGHEWIKRIGSVFQRSPKKLSIPISVSLLYPKGKGYYRTLSGKH
jgi:hypothetical protein